MEMHQKHFVSIMLKSALFLVCCWSAAWAGPSGARLYDLARAGQLFEEFVATHQKQYSTEHERQTRFAIFKDNLARINKRNKESTSSSAVFGINKFTDLSPEEFRQKYRGFQSRPKFGDSCSPVDAIDEVTVPSSFDWRDKKVVTRVKNQKDCGSCWSFSVTGNLESQYAIKYNELKEFSEQQLVDCDKKDGGCNGGDTQVAMIWLRDHGGIMSEADYPYTASDGKSCNFNKSEVQATVSGCFTIGQDETQIQQALIKYGPLSIGVDSYPFQMYTGGIFKDCANYDLDHAVLLVGYGEEDNTPFWIIKNSWGENWGEKGYIRVERNKNCCAMAKYVHTAVVN